jgi:hypothetical protein
MSLERSRNRRDAATDKPLGQLRLLRVRTAAGASAALVERRAFRCARRPILHACCDVRRGGRRSRPGAARGAVRSFVTRAALPVAALDDHRDESLMSVRAHVEMVAVVLVRRHAIGRVGMIPSEIHPGVFSKSDHVRLTRQSVTSVVATEVDRRSRAGVPRGGRTGRIDEFEMERPSQLEDLSGPGRVRRVLGQSIGRNELGLDRSDREPRSRRPLSGGPPPVCGANSRDEHDSGCDKEHGRRPGVAAASRVRPR